MRSDQDKNRNMFASINSQKIEHRIERHDKKYYIMILSTIYKLVPNLFNTEIYLKTFYNLF